ncbi:hypothetical protein C1646_721383, partial [Rhizophagus diaphanus]
IQSIDSLRELNSKLLAEIAELRKENAEISETKQLCDKAFDAEDKANRANQEEILYWYLYAKDFIIQLNGIIESSGSKFSEKKA